MRKAVSRFVISWGEMVVLLICLYHYASTVEVNLQPPNIQNAVQHSSTVIFSRSPVDYASSYRIYSEIKARLEPCRSGIFCYALI
ncbi:hypothetical protein DSECCO2_598960 [anaerobic digester metagenome]